MTPTPVALITGGTRGLGRELARSLSARGWTVVVDGRDPIAAADLAGAAPSIVVIRGDVTDANHQQALAASVDAFGRLDLLVNNASELGPSPLPTLATHPVSALRAVFETNVIAPVGLTRMLLPLVRVAGGVVLNVSSDAAVEAYAGWGGYGSSKAALDHVSAVLAVEEPQLRVYAVDPGDLRTDMHQRAFPDEDISDRPLPAAIVPALLRIVDVRPASGRYRASDWMVAEPSEAEVGR